MIFISYNCRGLGNPEIVRELRSIVKQEVPALLFVMETKIRAKRVENLQYQLGFGGCFAVDSDGLSGGIGLYWSKDVNVELKNYSTGHIDAMVQLNDQNSFEWRFTGFNGAPRVENRHHSWRFLRTLFVLPHSTWLCMGGFNETLFGDEHFSRSPRPEGQMQAFRQVVDDVSFQDLGWTGLPFTWDNMQQGVVNVKAHLDRAFANEPFRQKYDHIRVCHVSAVESDHCFIIVELQEHVHAHGVCRPNQFWYENVWQTHLEYEQLVTKTWQQQHHSPGLQGILDSLGALQSTLEPWGIREFGCLTRTVRQLQRKLDKLR